MPEGSPRRVTVVALCAMVTAVLAGCGSTTGITPPEVTAGAATDTFPATASGTLHIFDWTDYIDTRELDRFTRETGIKVVLDVYDSNETMLAKLQSGNLGYDIVFPSDYMVSQMRELNLLEPLNLSTFPNYGNIKSAYRAVPWDPKREFTAPFMYGTTGIVCDPAGSDCSAIKSWHDYFTTHDPKVSSIKDEVEVVSAALRAVGVKGSDLCTPDAAAFQRASDLLAGFHPIAIDSDSSTERVLNGDSTLEHTWNGEAHRIRSQHPRMVYIYPTEGLNSWADNIAIPVGAPNPDAARIFINWMLDPANIAAESAYTGYDNSIEGSAAFMPDALKSDPAVVPPADVVSRFTPTPDCPQAARDMYAQVFTTWLTR